MNPSRIHVRLPTRTSWTVVNPADAPAAEREAMEDMARRCPGKPLVARRVDALRGVVQVKR